MSSLIGINNNRIKVGGLYMRVPQKYHTRIAQNFIEFNLAQGYTLGYTKESIDVFCSETFSLLEKLDLCYLLSHNANFGTVNLINPETYRATAFGGLEWSADGVTGNGVNGCIDTNFNIFTQSSLGSKYQRDNASRGVILANLSHNGLNPVDGNTNPYANRLHINSIGNSPNRINGGVNMLNPASNRFVIINRTSSSETSLILGGETIVPFLENESTVLNSYGNQLILKAFSANELYSNAKIQLYSMGASLTLSESQTLRTAFNKLLTSNNLTPVA